MRATMSAEFSPGRILIMGAALGPLFRGHWRKAYMLLLPALSLAYLVALPHGEYGQVAVFDYVLTTVRVDKLSFVFGVVFHLAVGLSVLYALHEPDAVQHVAG